MRLRWTPNAADDLESIHVYLSQNHPAWAESTVRAIYAAARSLRTMPRGRAGAVEGTRELVMARLPYILVYRVSEHAVELLHIDHGAQDRRPFP